MLTARDAAGEHVEEFFLVHLTGGGAVGAADLVGKDFEAGHGVGFGVFTQEEVADFLVEFFAAVLEAF